MKRQSLVKGLLALTVVSVMTGCVDDKYDLTHIDTTSRFTVDDLTVPVNLSSIKLKNVVNLDDNDLIEKVTIDGKECYSIVQGGVINPTKFNIDKVEVKVPTIDPTDITIGLGGLSVAPGTYIPTEITLDPIEFPASQMVDYAFNMDDVPDALRSLTNIKTTTIEVKVTLSIPNELVGSNNKISFTDLKLQLPQNLMDVTGVDSYDPQTGETVINKVDVNSQGNAEIVILAKGLNLGSKGVIGEDHKLNITGSVGVLGGNINLTLQGINLPSSLKIDVNYKVEPFTVNSFSGSVNYNMDAIHIDPITLNDLPDFLDSPETNLVIANPQILVNIKNPVGDKLVGKGKIILTSYFKNGTKKVSESGVFELDKINSELAFCTKKEGAQYVSFEGLHDILSNGNAGLPSSIEVEIQDINFASDDVEDFPLGDLGDAEGSYEFNAPLGFGEGSVVIYETTEGDWGSDDLEKVNIKVINLSAVCTTNLPVGITLSIVPVDRNGNVIEVNEDNAGFEVPAYADKSPVTLKIAAKNGGTISGFDGVKFKAIVDQRSQNNTEALGPDQYIQLDNIRVTVDGYYETDF